MFFGRKKQPPQAIVKHHGRVNGTYICKKHTVFDKLFTRRVSAVKCYFRSLICFRDAENLVIMFKNKKDMKDEGGGPRQGG